MLFARISGPSYNRKPFESFLVLVYAQIVEFPAPTAYGLAALLLAFLVLLAGAVGLDARRKRALNRAARQGQWTAVERVMEERRLNTRETSLLRDLLRRHAREAPLEAVTTRHSFERMVDAAMREVALRGSEADRRQFGSVLRDIRMQLGLETTVLGQQIHSTRELEGGQRVEVALEGSEAWARFHVDDVDEAYLYLRYRDEPPVPQLPGAGQRVKCSLWRDEDGRYTFGTTVVATEAAPPRITLEHATRLSRTQSREHFRVRHDQSTMLGVLAGTAEDTASELELVPPATRVRGRITSLSAGGCAIVVHDSISRRMLLRIALEVAEGKPLVVHGKIVASQPISGGRYLLRVEFLNVPEEAADAISKYVMRKQQQSIAARQNRDSA